MGARPFLSIFPHFFVVFCFKQVMMTISAIVTKLAVAIG